MVKLIITCLFISTSFMTEAQDAIRRTSVFLELAGSGGLGSLNFERSFLKREKTELTWRLGLSFAPIDKNNGFGIVVPIMVHALFGEKNHKLELGLGQGLTLTTKGKFFLLTTPSIGYRWQSDVKKIFFRAAYTPLVSYLVHFQTQQWFGLSLGYAFKKK